MVLSRPPSAFAPYDRARRAAKTASHACGIALGDIGGERRSVLFTIEQTLASLKATVRLLRSSRCNPYSPTRRHQRSQSPWISKRACSFSPVPIDYPAIPLGRRLPKNNRDTSTRLRDSSALEDALRLALAEIALLKNLTPSQSTYLRHDMFADLSHDLRTPIALIQGYLDTVLVKEASMTLAERRAYVEVAAKQSRQLGVLIAELIELAKLDYDCYQIQPEAVHLGELGRDVLQEFALAATTNGVTLVAEVESGIGFVKADIGLIERVLRNLIANALAHSSRDGEIRLSVLPTDDEIEVRVSDIGVGVPAEELPHVFERFVRGKVTRRRDTSGAGLGLAIVKRILELHGAEIRVQSVSGEGTVFWFTLARINVDQPGTTRFASEA